MARRFDLNMRFLRFVAFIMILAYVAIMISMETGFLPLPEGAQWVKPAVAVFLGLVTFFSCLVLLLTKPPSGPADIVLDSAKSVAEGKSLAEAREMVQAVAASLAELVDALSERSEAQGQRLDVHSATISRTVDLKDIRQIQEKILNEIATIKKENHQLNEGLRNIRGELNAQESKMAHFEEEVMIDHLTTVPNRRALDQRIEEEFNRAARYGGVFSLMMIDLDDFKALNDEYGHLAGDRILRGISKLLSNETRTSDFVARYGGEEFVVMLPETRLKKAADVAEKLRRSLDRVIFRLEDKRLHVTASFGVSEFTEGESIQDLLQRADDAMYTAKRQGKNMVCTESEIQYFPGKE